jgi:NADP-dependent 3-hydroxy acid dehydrogenase YdfG
MTSLKDQVAIITGASSGIGAATARELAGRGVRVMLTARREDRLQNLRQKIESEGGRATCLAADVTLRQDVEKVVGATLATFGRVDVLFNNAGIMPLSLMPKVKVEEWEQMVDVNVKGLLYFIGAVLPPMMAQNSGHIVNTASVAAHVLFPGAAVYCGTKYAVRAITEGLRLDLRPQYAIRVSLISPGAVATELAQRISDLDVRRSFEQSGVTPLPAESIARAVCWALEQPTDVDVNEIVVRPRSQKF